MEKLVLKNSEIVFANLVDTGFGKALVIKVTADNEKSILDFWSENKIGNDKTVIGSPTIKEYEGTKQLSLKINDSTKFAYLGGLSEANLGYGCICDIVLNAFEYNNKFTKGKDRVGVSISAVVVVKGKRSGSDTDIAELLSQRQQEFDTAQVEAVTSPGKPAVGADDLPF